MVCLVVMDVLNVVRCVFDLLVLVNDLGFLVVLGVLVASAAS